jgi:hypothetical protein
VPLARADADEEASSRPGDDRVLGVGRAVDEVPAPERALLPFDEPSDSRQRTSSALTTNQPSPF